MIDIDAHQTSNTVELTIDGNITTEEFDGFIAKLDAVIKQHGKVRILEHIVKLGTIPPSRVIQDISFVVRHRKDFERVAVVGDQAWLGLVATLAKPFVAGDLKRFKSEQIDEARAWLEADAEGETAEKAEKAA